MNKKISKFVLILLLMVSVVNAERTCQNVQEANTLCQIVTPVIDCSTYDLYNSTLELRINDGAMSQIGATGMYNFTFNQPDSGTHKILLCDNTTATIEVAAYSQKVIYDNNLDNFSSLQSYGDNNWSAATGFMTDLIMNDSHGLGLYNSTGGTASVSSSDIIDIANATFNQFFQNRTEIYFNNSLGYPVYDIWNYLIDGFVINVSYGYFPDNMTILNKSIVRIT